MPMTDIFLAVDEAMTPEQRERLLARATIFREPSLGTQSADALDAAYVHDIGLEFCEPYFTRAGSVLAIALVSDALQRPTTRSLVWVCALAVAMMTAPEERAPAIDVDVERLARAAARLLTAKKAPARADADGASA